VPSLVYLVEQQNEPATVGLGGVDQLRNIANRVYGGSRPYRVPIQQKRVNRLVVETAVDCPGCQEGRSGNDNGRPLVFAKGIRKDFRMYAQGNQVIEAAQDFTALLIVRQRRQVGMRACVSSDFVMMALAVIFQFQQLVPGDEMRMANLASDDEL